MVECNLRKKINLYLQKENISDLEKEVFNLILLASKSYSDLHLFFIDLYQKGISIITTVIGLSEVLQLCDRHYVEIENRISVWEKESNKFIIFERFVYIKVQMFQWVIFDILKCSMISILLLPDSEIIIETFPDLNPNEFEYSEEFYQLYYDFSISSGIKIFCQNYQAFWLIVDKIYTIQLIVKVKKEFFQSILLELKEDFKSTFITVNKEIYQELLLFPIPLPKIGLYYSDMQLLFASEY